jgi:hypothetical protein
MMYLNTSPPSHLSLYVKQPVLPGPDAASLPTQKNLPLFGENSPLFQIFLKFRYFSAIFGLFL